MEGILTTAVPEYTKVMRSTALLYAYSVDGFTRIVASRNAQNGPTNILPPVMPQKLIQMRSFEFSHTALLHKQHLEVSMSEYDIVMITDDFKQLRNAYQSEEQTKASLMDSITKQVLIMDRGPSLIDFQHCVQLQEDWHLSFLELVL